MRLNLYTACCIFVATLGQAVTTGSSADSYVSEWTDGASYDFAQTYGDTKTAAKAVKDKAKAETKKAEAKAKVAEVKAKAATPAVVATPAAGAPAAAHDLNTKEGIANAIKAKIASVAAAPKSDAKDAKKAVKTEAKKATAQKKKEDIKKKAEEKKAEKKVK